MNHSCVRPDEAAIVEGTFDSIFHIEIDLRHLLAKEQPDITAVTKYYEISGDVESGLKKRKVPTSGRPPPSKSAHITRNSPTRYSTGFAIAQNEKLLRILTCAHTIPEVYHKDKHYVTCQDINSFYRFQVHCFHQEKKLVEEAGDKPLCEIERYVTEAFVVGLDTQKYLMALELLTERLFNGVDTDGNPVPCGSLHPVLKMAESTNVLDKVFLQGWPPQCYRTLTCGQLSFADRPYAAISSLNPKGYTMKLTEISGLLGPEGSSGGPVINHENRVLGVFDGVLDGRGLLISRGDIGTFLKENGLMIGLIASPTLTMTPKRNTKMSRKMMRNRRLKRNQKRIGKMRGFWS